MVHLQKEVHVKTVILKLQRHLTQFEDFHFSFDAFYDQIPA